MAYEKQGFYSGEKLKASQLDAMEDGIIEAERLAQEGAASAANMEKGAGENATQQLQDQEAGVTEGYFDFTDKNPNATVIDSSLTGEIEYGATGNFASAFGGKCAAIGKRSMAIGSTTIAKGPYSLAAGNNTVTLGANSFTTGLQTVAKGEGAVAEGLDTQAIGGYSHAQGYKTIANGYGSFAGGATSEAGGDYSFAFGEGVKATKPNQVAVGRFNDTTFMEGKGLFIVGNGDNDSHRKTEFVVAPGASYFAGDLYAGGIEETNKVVIAGYVNPILADLANKIDQKPLTKVAGQTESAVMQNCSAPQNYAMAINVGTKASGYGSFAIGDNTEAKGTCSFAGGAKTIAERDYQTVVGMFNNNKSNTLFEVGNGANADNRSNAFEVYLDGDIGIKYGNNTYSLHKMLAAYFTEANLK